MDRDGSGRSPPEEVTSFDVAKMSEAEVAAEIVQRMTRWRRVNDRADATGRTSAAEPALALSAAPVDLQPAESPPAADRPPNAKPRPDLTGAARLERALRMAARKAVAPVPDAATQPVEETTESAAGSAPGGDVRIDPAPRRAPALDSVAWQALSDWPVVAGAALLAIAIAGWLLMPRDLAPSPEVGPQVATEAASSVEAPAPIVVAAPTPPPVAVPPPAALAPPKTEAPMPATLKPVRPGPTLVARLKPTIPAAAPAAAKPVAAPPVAAPPQPKPQQPQGQNIQAQKPADDSSTSSDPDDIEDMLDWMFSDGLGRPLP